MEGKIVIFCPALISGGLERVISVLSKPFAECYDSVEIVMWHDMPVFYEIDSRVKIVCAEKEHKGFLKKMWWLRKHIISLNPDLVISFSTPFNIIALLSLYRSGQKVIVSERNDPAYLRWGSVAKLLRNLLYLKADGIIVQTKTSKTHLWNKLYSKIKIIPNPILMKEVIIGAALTKEKKNKIVTVARLVPQKRIDLLINVFYGFIKIHSDYILEIYGDGKEKETLKKNISDMGLENHVFLKGAVSNVWDKILDAKMFVLTSEYEGMPNALMEAMCLGLPCISTKVCGAVDLIESGKNGVLIDVDDNKELLHQMTQLAENTELRKELGENASLIHEKYCQSKVSKEWVNYIDNRLRE